MRRAYVAASAAVSGFGPGQADLFDGVFSGASALRARDRLAAVDCLTEVAGEAPARRSSWAPGSDRT